MLGTADLGNKVWRPWIGEQGVLVLRGHRTPSANLTFDLPSHLTFPAQLPFGQNFQELWLLPQIIHVILCFSGLWNSVVNLFFKVSIKDSHVLPCVSPVPCADHHGIVSIWDHKLWRRWPKLCESECPRLSTPFHSRLDTKIDTTHRY